MTGSTEYNKIVSTVTSVTQDYQYFSSQDSCIVIDTSNNNIGINNINPTAHIDISGLRHDDAGKILKINGQSYFEYVDGDYIIKEKFLQLKVGDEQISEVRTAINKMQTITISGGHEIRHETGTNYLIIDPSGIDINSLDGQHKGTVQIRGNLEVLGNTTTIYSSTIDISDKNITLGSNAPNSQYLDEAGIDISNVARFRYKHEQKKWQTNIGINISGDLSVNNIDVSNILIQNQLDVSNVTISNNLLIHNQLDVSNVTISNNLLIYNQLDVSNVTISNNLLINNQLDVSNVTISNNLLIHNQLDISNAIKINSSDISYYIYFGNPSTNIIGTDISKIDTSYSYSYSYVRTVDISKTNSKINLPTFSLPIGGQHIMHIDNSGDTNNTYTLQGWADSNYWSKHNKRLCNFESELEIEKNKHLLLTVTRMNELYFYSGSVYSFNET
jgi:hypothetical protein